MSTYNYLHFQGNCPACKTTQELTAQLYFGYADCLSFHIGDIYRWRDRKAIQNGGRPTEGNVDAEGWVNCPNCDDDFYVVVRIRKDKIVGVEYDPSKPSFTQWEQRHNALTSVLSATDLCIDD